MTPPKALIRVLCSAIAVGVNEKNVHILPLTCPCHPGWWLAEYAEGTLSLAHIPSAEALGLSVPEMAARLVKQNPGTCPRWVFASIENAILVHQTNKCHPHRPLGAEA